MSAGKTLAVGVLAAILIGAAHVSRGHAFRHNLQSQRYEDRYYLPPPSWLVVSSLGYREALAGFVWTAMLENFGEELQHRGHAKYFFHYGDAIVTLDPFFKRAYQWMGTVSLYRLGKPSPAESRRAGSYLERAAEIFPEDGELMWLLGAHYSYEMPSTTRVKEEKAEFKRKGLEYIRTAALLGAGPPWLGLTAATDLESLGQKDRAIRHLKEIYMTVEDPDTKARIGARLAKLQNASFLEAMNRAEINLRKRKQEHFPYLEDAMYLLVGPRPPVDEAGAMLRYFDPLGE
ncbi:MAG: hypothetical protein OXR73_02325 [Myxococcales bacterium]|nr:hypothetical protein [Myxococcales bacterium]